jgi:hypothetical protein
MNMSEFTIAAVILAGVAMLVAAAAVMAARRALGKQATLSQRLGALEQQYQLQQQSISGLTAGAVGMDRRLRRAEAADKIISDRQESIENQQAAEQPYGHAIRLVQQGAGARRLMEELGLSESEASLLVRLHGLHETG